MHICRDGGDHSLSLSPSIQDSQAARRGETFRLPRFLLGKVLYFFDGSGR